MLKKNRIPSIALHYQRYWPIFSKSGISSNTVVLTIRKDSILHHYFHILWGSLSKQLFSYWNESNYFLSLLCIPFTPQINVSSEQELSFRLWRWWSSEKHHPKETPRTLAVRRDWTHQWLPPVGSPGLFQVVSMLPRIPQTAPSCNC